MDSILSWATVSIFALLVLDVSTEIGEYLRMIRRAMKETLKQQRHERLHHNPSASNNEKDQDAQLHRHHDQRSAELEGLILQWSLWHMLGATVILVVTGLTIGSLTRHMDWRMHAILNGLSELEASVVFFYLSCRIPQWSGLYHTSSNSVNAHTRLWSQEYLPEAVELLLREIISETPSIRSSIVQENNRLLIQSVRKSMWDPFFTIFPLLLPFVGRPLSVVVGLGIGVVIDGCIYVARRADRDTDTTPQDPAGGYQDSLSGTTRRKALFTHAVAMLVGMGSSWLFASGCHYIQTVWKIQWITNERLLAFGAFGSWLLLLTYTHSCFWKNTKRHVLQNRRISTAAKRERLAMSLVVSLWSKDREMLHLADQEIEQEEERQRLLKELHDKGLAPSGVSSTYDSIDTSNEVMAKIKATTDGQEDTDFEKGWRGTLMVLWSLATIFSLFLVVVNIGATYQMNIVRERFPNVHSTLYEHMNEGAVCALHVDTGTVRTFSDRKEANAAKGYAIVHCGACGACSNWHDLRLEFTTRTMLASASAACARKSLYGGRGAVLTCLQEEPIGFHEECAVCWTDDILCSKHHCSFLFLQSTLINKMANFEVSADDITSATCEEAMCELVFVPCSGASRRRMNVISDISRPVNEQCSILDINDWELVFDEQNDVYDRDTMIAVLQGGSAL